jgi:hypothetical protein
MVCLGSLTKTSSRTRPSSEVIQARSMVVDENERGVFRCERLVGAGWLGHDILLQKGKVSCDCAPAVRRQMSSTGARGAGRAVLGLHCPHRGASADPGTLIRRPLLDIRAVKSSILERNVLRIGDVFAL